MHPEEWRAVRGFADFYEVSDSGYIRRKVKGSRTPAGHILNPYILPNGYARVKLCGYNKAQEFRYVHHIVLDAFVGHKEVGRGAEDFQANHKDGNKKNNCAANLEYISHRDNLSHAVANNLTAHGVKNGIAVLNPEKVLVIRELLQSMNRGQIAKLFGVSVSCIQYIHERRTWKQI